ncbi:phage minor head protein [Planomicrobium okeanokoites]|uniref:phage minor head protein n=1 Tax=Planomicrobium okeanokoites TaxID=244 RepID=UPI000A022268|nr:phage minor head protein [Planomicrobium okeanokoites]
MNLFEIEEELDRLLIKAESDLEKVFSKRLKTILFQISRMYRKYEEDGKLSFTELNKYNRFQKELDLIAKLLTDDYRQIIKDLQQLTETQYVTKYLMTAYLIEMSVRPAPAKGFSIPSIGLIKEVLLNPIKELTLPKIMEQHRNDIVRRINIEIAQALIAGEGYSEMAKRLEKVLGFASNKARLVARTEAGRSRSIAAEKVNEVASQFAETTKVWASMLDHRVRMSHRFLDGKIADKNGVFKFKKNFTTAPRLWVGPDAAALTIQCRCVIIYLVNGMLPEYRRERDYMDAGYQRKLARRIEQYMVDEVMTYKQAVKRVQKEIQPPQRVIPYVPFEEWKNKKAV